MSSGDFFAPIRKMENFLNKFQIISAWNPGSKMCKGSEIEMEQNKVPIQK